MLVKLIEQFRMATFAKPFKLFPSNSLAKATIEVRDELLTKHPQAPPPQLPNGPPPTPTLLASQKKDGNHHPIAVGEVLRWLVSKCLARTVHLEAANILAPFQVDIGIPAGSEAVAHAVSTIQNDHSIPSSHKWTLLLDFSNAFNSIDMDRCLRR